MSGLGEDAANNMPAKDNTFQLCCAGEAFVRSRRKVIGNRLVIGNVFGLNVTSIALKILSVYVPRKRCVHVNNRIFKPVDDEPQMPIEHAFVSTLSRNLFATASNLLRRCYVVKNDVN